MALGISAGGLGLSSAYGTLMCAGSFGEYPGDLAGEN